VCFNNMCAAAACNDAILNGDESDVDCGGSCAPCADSETCNVAADCLNGVCTGNVCQAPSCTDAVLNGDETDVDCGGGTCPACADAQACVISDDCTSLVCTGGFCQAPSCTDSIKNGTEVGLDCGGSCAACHLVINEIDYDQDGTDDDEFVEIYNGTGAPVSLANLSLLFVNGSTSTVYKSVTLGAAGTIADDQYLVVGVDKVLQTLPASVLKVLLTPATNAIENGSPDGVALVDSVNLVAIDGLSYEGTTLANIPGFGTVSLVEGNALPAAVADDNAVITKSLVRYPNGIDHNDAATDWKLTTLFSPGAANILVP
jgi:hypothetical protein